jgi:spore maturation protein CgeB
MNVLFVASLHHPPPGALPPLLDDAPGSALFPQSQLQHFWVAALRRLGHRCAVFWRTMGAGPLRPAGALRMAPGLTPSRVLNRLALAAPRANPFIRRRNRQLLEAAGAFGPDLVVLVGDNDVVLPETVAALRARIGATIVYASGTSPIVFSRPLEREAAPLFDLVVVNDFYHAVQWRELGAPRAEVLPLCGVDPSFHTPAANATPGGRVVFAGTLVPERLYRHRIAALEALTESPLDLWSVHAVPPSLAPWYRGGVLGQQMIDVLAQAAVVVNPHGDFMQHGGNMRLFEACGAGAFQVVDDRPAVREWFVPGEHLVTYRTPDELRAIVAEYLADDARRQRVAEAGRRHVHAHHTYDQRMMRLMALVGGLGRR